MGRPIQSNLLTDLQLEQIQASVTRGYFSDGGGLFLYRGAAGSLNWRFRYMFRDHSNEIAFGPLKEVSLFQARQKASIARMFIKYDGNPLEYQEYLNQCG